MSHIQVAPGLAKHRKKVSKFIPLHKIQAVQLFDIIYNTILLYNALQY